MALSNTPEKLESVFVQRDTENQHYEQINVSGSDLIFYHSSSGEFMADKISVWAAKYGIGTGGGGASLGTGSTYPFTASFAVSASSSDTSSFLGFNGNRSITRSPYNGINLGTSGVVDFLEEFFFPFNTASISINSGTTYYETGSSQNISILGSITANSETVFDSGSVRRSGGSDWYTFSSASSYSTTDTGLTGSRTYQAFMRVGNEGSPTNIYSSTKTISFIFPYLYGTSSAAGLSGVDLYNALSGSKSITVEATKTPSLVGVSTYIYFCFPKSYGSYTYHELSSIRDPSNFEVLSSFDYSASVAITSSGLTNNWQALYNVYRLTLQANPNGTFTFTHGSTVA